MLQLALSYLNGKDYKNALIYTNAAVSANNNYINKDAYIAYDLRAQAHLPLGDSSFQRLHCVIQQEKT